MNALLCCLLLAATPLASLTSPNGQVRADLTLGARGEPCWSVGYGGRPVLRPSPLGLVVSGRDLTAGLRVVGVSEPVDGVERYELRTGPCQRVVSPYRQQSMRLRSAAGDDLLIDLRVADGGVAVRYRVPPPAGYDGQPVTVTRDATGFAFTPGRAWLLPYHQPSEWTPAYEDYFQEVAIGQAPGHCRGPGPADGWSFGGLHKLADGRAWALTVESGVDETWCGTHLSDGVDGVYRVRWPLAGEFKKKVPAVLACPPTPVTSLPLVSPWRGLALGGQAGDIVTSTWPTDLAKPAEMPLDWVQSGRASWSWLSCEGAFDRGQFRTFLDLGARHGWEYSLLDAGWWNVPLAELAAGARERSVRLLLWGDSTEMYDVPDRRRRINEAADAGVAGFKIDFWCSDKQLAVKTMLDLLRDAAKRQLVIVLHGCTVPRGWQRTFPNLLSAEAVLGEETYRFEGDFGQRAPAHHAILPFTRNVLAPMDYTPAVLDGSPWRHSATTAHQLALTALFTSGVQHFGGHATWYDRLPAEAQALLTALPPAWDESRCLAADPGRYVVVARRSGDRWWVAGINGTDRPVTLPAAMPMSGPMVCLSDAPDGRLQVGQALPATMAAYGGYLAFW